ncbi:MAG: hypothetical protein M1833_007358 [Piccolia ochrophora]|nr:MAG: hypothetical protein M1833_007358 [Piccolia ochrophora]
MSSRPVTSFQDRPDSFLRQTYYENPPRIVTSPAVALVYLFVTAALLHQFLRYRDYPLLSIGEILWNMAVYLTPAPLIFALDHRWGPLASEAAAGHDNSVPSQAHAAKSEALRRLLGWERGGFISSISGSNAISAAGTSSPFTGGRPPGLGNWDNSCYQNSVIQGLASLHSLSSYLEGVASEGSDDEPMTSARTATAALKFILKQLNDTSNSGRRFWTPAELKSMSSWQQQDAQEYFSKVLDEVDKAIMQTSRSSLKDTGLHCSFPTHMSDDVNGQHPHLQEIGSQPDKVLDTNVLGRLANTTSKRVGLEDSKKMISLRNPLEGLLAQRVGCLRCGWSEGLSLIPFICLTVPLGKEWCYDVRECLDDYTELEQIQGVECAKCTLLNGKRQVEQLLEKSQKSESPPGMAEGQEEASTQQQQGALAAYAAARLGAINEALEDEDFSESTLANKCKISPKNRITTTKSRQAVIARAPKSLVIHVNRSVFDEYSGVQRKNYAEVNFQKYLDLGQWCLGYRSKKCHPEETESLEKWVLDPAESMLDDAMDMSEIIGPIYEIRAVITHYGRHENGHYVCYRRYPSRTSRESAGEDDGYVKPETWWQISDDDVLPSSEEEVLNQGGVFMLLYERIDRESSSTSPETMADAVDGTREGDKTKASVDGITLEPLTPSEIEIQRTSNDSTPRPPIQLKDQPRISPIVSPNDASGMTSILSEHPVPESAKTQVSTREPPTSSTPSRPATTVFDPSSHLFQTTPPQEARSRSSPILVPTSPPPEARKPNTPPPSPSPSPHLYRPATPRAGRVAGDEHDGQQHLTSSPGSSAMVMAN